MQPQGQRGIDVSHFQGYLDFVRAKQNGVYFTYAKASQGLTEIDSCFAANRVHAKNANMLFGAYHFFDPSADALGQAEHFMKVAVPKSGDMIPMLDVETPSENVGHDALACAYEIKHLCGHFPLLYSGQAFYLEHLASVFPPDTTLWIARYGAKPTVPCAIWQFTESGGFTQSGRPVDGDVYLGDDFSSLIIP